MESQKKLPKPPSIEVVGNTTLSIFDSAKNTNKKRKTVTESVSDTAVNCSTNFKPGFNLPQSIRKYFTYDGHKLKNGNPTRNVLVSCNLCTENKHRSFTEGSTSNLIRHLETQHIETFQADKIEGAKKSDQRSILDFCEGASKKLPNSDTKQKRFDAAILSLLASNRASFHVLNTQEFREVIHTADPRITVKSRQAMLAQLSKIVKSKVLPDLRKDLKAIDAATLSLDLWTSHRKDGVLAVKIFYVNHDFILKKRTISIIEVNEKHDAAYICKMVMNVLNDFSILGKVKFIVTDNGLNVIKAMKDLKINSEDTQAVETIIGNDCVTQTGIHEPTCIDVCSYSGSDNDDDDELEGPICNDDDEIESDIEENLCEEYKREVLIKGIDVSVKLLNNVLQLVEPSKDRIPCCAHVLQLVFKSGLKAEKEPVPTPSNYTHKNPRKSKTNIGKAWDIIQLVNKIVKFFRNSSVWLSRLRKTAGKGLLKHAETRWNYIYDVLVRLNEDTIFKSVQNLLYQASLQAKYAYEKKRHPGLLTFEHRHQIRELIKVLQPLCVLTDVLQSDSVTSPLLIPQLLRAVKDLNEMQNLSYFNKLRQSLLHQIKQRFEPLVAKPAFLLASLLDPRQKLNVFKLQTSLPQTDIAIPTAASVMHLCEAAINNQDKIVLEKDAQPDEEMPQLQNPNALSIFKQMEIEVSQTELTQEKKLTEYLGMKIDLNTDPLLFWKQNMEKLLNLSQLAKVYLSIPATSASTERLFSELSALARISRSRMMVSRQCECILYKEWLRDFRG